MYYLLVSVSTVIRSQCEKLASVWLM
uniref:Uncharacterized protein n=1 Tax=Anguilla anguilla TaxID=7936 RepID=A0A0E9VVV8_ANGAN